MNVMFVRLCRAGPVTLTGQVPRRLPSGSRAWGRLPIAIVLLICLTVPVRAARGQSSQRASGERATLENLQEYMSQVMADYDRRQKRDDEERARQVAEYDREMAEQRQGVIDDQARQSRALAGFLIFAVVSLLLLVYVVRAARRRQKAALLQVARMIELLESIDRRLPGPGTPKAG